MGLHPRPRWRSLQHFPRPVAGFKGSCISKGKEGKEGGEERVRGGQWKGRGRRWTAPFPNSWIRHCQYSQTKRTNYHTILNITSSITIRHWWNIQHHNISQFPCRSRPAQIVSEWVSDSYLRINTIRLYSDIHDGCSGNHRTEDKLQIQRIQKLHAIQRKQTTQTTAKQNCIGLVAAYDTRPGNEVGLFYNAPELIHTGHNPKYAIKIEHNGSAVQPHWQRTVASTSSVTSTKPVQGQRLEETGHYSTTVTNCVTQELTVSL